MRNGDRPREWHAWSVWKSEVLFAGYLVEFVKAGISSQHRVFIDCFAGSSENVEFGTGRDLQGSPRIALNVEPPFTHLLFFELPEHASQLAARLSSEYPGREIKVISGDCNLSIDDGLEWIRSQGGPKSGPHLGQTLAFLDPDSLELEWDTVVRLAKWQMSNTRPSYKRRNRIELLILFPTGPMRRQLPQPPKVEASEQQKQIVDRLFGSKEWRRIYQAQRQKKIFGEESWLYYVNEYRLQLVELGYNFTAAIEVKNTSNAVLYHMIFATGNNTGQKIMKSVLAKARAILPTMVDEEKARRRNSGPRLFDETDSDLERIKADPGRWAKLYSDPPEPFNPDGPNHYKTSQVASDFQPRFPDL